MLLLVSNHISRYGKLERGSWASSLSSCGLAHLRALGPPRSFERLMLDAQVAFGRVVTLHHVPSPNAPVHLFHGVHVCSSSLTWLPSVTPVLLCYRLHHPSTPDLITVTQAVTYRYIQHISFVKTGGGDLYSDFLYVDRASFAARC